MFVARRLPEHAHQLQRDVAIELRVIRAIHHPHGTGADHIEHDVAVDLRAARDQFRARRQLPGIGDVLVLLGRTVRERRDVERTCELRDQRTALHTAIDVILDRVRILSVEEAHELVGVRARHRAA